MGWFSKHIMGGDEAMDAEAMIMGIIEMDDSDGIDVELAKQRLTASQNIILEQCESDIDIQVLGVVMLKYGAALNPDVKERIIKALKDDEWAKEEYEREILIQDFIEIIESYDNATPTDCTIDHEARFGVTNQDWINGRFSSKIALMALYYFHKKYRDAPWYKDSTVIFNGRGYAILAGLTEEGQGEKIKDIISSVYGIFEIPVYFCDGAEMQYVSNEDTVNRIKFNGDIRKPYVVKEKLTCTKCKKQDGTVVEGMFDGMCADCTQAEL